MASEQHIIYARTERATSAALAKDRFVRVTSGKVRLSTAGGLPYGVSGQAVAASTVREDQWVKIIQIGVASVEVSSTGGIVKGARVGVAANGKAKTAVANTPYGGIALTSGAATEVMPILLAPASQTTL